MSQITDYGARLIAAGAVECAVRGKHGGIYRVHGRRGTYLVTVVVGVDNTLEWSCTCAAGRHRHRCGHLVAGLGKFMGVTDKTSSH